MRRCDLFCPRCDHVFAPLGTVEEPMAPLWMLCCPRCMTPLVEELGA